MTLALRTRLFCAVLSKLGAEAETPEAMIASRGTRDGQVAMRGSWLVFGRTARGVETIEVVVEREWGNQRFLIHRPSAPSDSPLPVVLNFHGGGWCVGTPEQSRWVASNLAARVGAIVVSPSYRLAPEHPYPAAINDAEAALAWVAKEIGAYGGDAERIAVMGDSAGGNLAAVTALIDRDSATPRIKAQVLIYPCVEMYEVFPSEDEFADGPLLTKAGMKRFAHFYMGEQYGVEDWQASPIRSETLTGLAPALVLSATVDPLRDNSRNYVKALRAAEVAVTEVELPDAIHGFISLPGAVPAAKRGLAAIVDFLQVEFSR